METWFGSWFGSKNSSRDPGPTRAAPRSTAAGAHHHWHAYCSCHTHQYKHTQKTPLDHQPCIRRTWRQRSRCCVACRLRGSSRLDVAKDLNLDLSPFGSVVRTKLRSSASMRTVTNRSPDAAKSGHPRSCLGRQQLQPCLSPAVSSTSSAFTTASSSSNGDDLPRGWRQAEEQTSGRVYYYSRLTGQRSWHHPAGCDCKNVQKTQPLLQQHVGTSADNSSNEHDGYHYAREWKKIPGIGSRLVHYLVPDEETLERATMHAARNSYNLGNTQSPRSSCSSQLKTVQTDGLTVPIQFDGQSRTSVANTYTAEHMLKRRPEWATNARRKSVVHMLAALDKVSIS
eukprot:SAG31_NODE_2419_length_5727_cov_4.235963_2_plen_341_part_00